MPDEVIKLAADVARETLKQQDATLASVRNRATGLLAAATVGTSFAAAAGFMNTDPAKGQVLPLWSAWALLALVLLIGACVMYVLWPVPHWTYGPSSARILQAADDGNDLDDVLRKATVGMNKAIGSQMDPIRQRVAAYRVGVVILLIETAVLLITLLVGRR
jgi:hypothetical protein